MLRKVREKTRTSSETYIAYGERRVRRFDKEISQKVRFLIGVDEAGRGPLAGPVAVGVAIVPVYFDWTLILGVGDSKKVTPKNREAIFRRAKQLKKDGLLDFAVVLVSAKVIDKIGITKAVALGITRAFAKLNPNPDATDVRLDGLLKAPPQFTNQQTIIKGDQKEKVIGLASIMAKVTRDDHMVRLARLHPHYHFEVHKGYGTKVHRGAILKYGISGAHRQSFCKKFI